MEIYESPKNTIFIPKEMKIVRHTTMISHRNQINFRHR